MSLYESWCRGPCRSFIHHLGKPLFIRRFNGTATLVWACLVVPTVLVWKQSILWIALMSVWANLATHYGAWISARVEVRAEHVEETSTSEETTTEEVTSA